MKHIFYFYLLVSCILFYSCDEKKTDINFNWQDITGEYTGEFSYGLEGENKDYWFIVERKVSFNKISSNTFKVVFKDTSFNSIAFHLTTKNPYLDMTFYKQIQLDSLDLEFFEVQNDEEPVEGTLEGILRIMNEDYWEPSGLLGIKYLTDEKYTESIHMVIERFLPTSAESVDSTESITFHAYR